MQPFQFTFNGVSWGDGTDFDVYDISGLDMPGLRTADLARAQAHGTHPSRDWLGGRTISMSIEADSMTTDWESLLAGLITTVEELPLTFQIPGQSARRVYARCRRRAFVIGEEFSLGAGTLAVEFYASDPRQYDDTLSSLSTGLPTLSGGLTFPATAPFVFGSPGTGGGLAAANAGSFEAPWVVVFNGPLVAPSITHTAQSRTLLAAGADLASGETLVLDGQAKTALLNGTASRYSWLSNPQWFTLEPGANNLQFTAASGTGTCDIRYRSAYL